MKTVIILAAFLSFINMKAQDLKTHQWKNRILLVISENESTESFKKQIAVFKGKAEALTDRKLVIYKVLPKRCKLNDEVWVMSSKLFQKFKTKNETFKVVLIGLDGSVKLNENEVISAEKLFSVIDSMPMRKSEIKRN